jgi:hypothetical protein
VALSNAPGAGRIVARQPVDTGLGALPGAPIDHVKVTVQIHQSSAKSILMGLTMKTTISVDNMVGHYR